MIKFLGHLLLLPALTLAASPKGTPKVLIVSIDGLRPDYVLEADRFGLKIPELRRLLLEGTYAKHVTGVAPTLTYPSHTTLVTGVSPAKHGILSNVYFDPENKNRGGWQWYAEDIKVPTLWDLAEKKGLATVSVDWPVTVGAHIRYLIPQMFRGSSPTLDDHKILKALATPGLLTEVEKKIGIYPAGYQYQWENDKTRTEFSLYLMNTKHPSLQLAYLSSLDEEQHSSGPYSAATKATLEKIDVMIGDLRRNGEKTAGGNFIFCVVSDHGFGRVDKEIRLNVALKEAGLLKLDEKGNLSSWQAYAWGADGSSAIYLNDPRDEETRTKVDSLINKLIEDPDSGIDKAVNPSTTLGFTGAHLVINARSGFAFTSTYKGPMVDVRGVGGSHGYLPENPDMDAAFFIVGRNITKGKAIERIDMRDIAPTLAKIMGLSLPTAEGKTIF